MRIIISVVFILALSLGLMAQEKQENQQNQQAPAPSIGKSVGRAVNMIVTAVTTDGQRLADSETGRFTIAMVAWKVAGKKALQWAIGIPLLWIGLLFWWHFYSRNCLRRAVIVEDTDQVDRFDVVEPSEQTGLSYAFVLLAILAVGYLIIFAR